MVGYILAAKQISPFMDIQMYNVHWLLFKYIFCRSRPLLPVTISRTEMSDFKSHTTRGITSDGTFCLRWMIILTNCFSRYYRISKYFRPPWADVNRVTVTMQYLHYTIKEVETSWIISTVNTHVTWHHEPNTLTCSPFCLQKVFLMVTDLSEVRASVSWFP